MQRFGLEILQRTDDLGRPQPVRKIQTHRAGRLAGASGRQTHEPLQRHLGRPFLIRNSVSLALECEVSPTRSASA